jgi:hypothetical protein
LCCAVATQAARSTCNVAALSAVNILLRFSADNPPLQEFHEEQIEEALLRVRFGKMYDAIQRQDYDALLKFDPMHIAHTAILAEEVRESLGISHPLTSESEVLRIGSILATKHVSHSFFSREPWVKETCSLVKELIKQGKVRQAMSITSELGLYSGSTKELNDILNELFNISAFDEAEEVILLIMYHIDKREFIALMERLFDLQKSRIIRNEKLQTVAKSLNIQFAQGAGPTVYRADKDSGGSN